MDTRAPKKCMKQWKALKQKCEDGDEGENKHIVEQMKCHCKLESNQHLPYLIRTEGGLGGDNNTTDKQIRFRMSIFEGEDNDIVFGEICNTNVEMWTYEELFDLIRAFTKTANHIVGADWVSGCIEITNNDEYISDSD
jgi:hypothetical protein